MPEQPDDRVPGSIEFVERTLREMGPFYYWPNDGNLGDYLIAEATRQLFRRWGLEWREYNPEKVPGDESYAVVYGGGGRFVHHWGGMALFEQHLTRPEVSRCVILPHSIHGVDSFVRSLDERHSVFCRERRTLNYCRTLNKKATFMLAHDLGLYLTVGDLPIQDSLIPMCAETGDECRTQYELLTGGRTAYAAHRMSRATVRCSSRNFTFVLRTDKEKNSAVESKWAYDFSALYSASCRETPYSALLVRYMADTLKASDVVVTDRLHVAIMAMHMGRSVYMLDNDYGKLSGVYENSLKDNPRVHLLPPGEPWPVELQRAWKKLNSPWRDRYFAARRFARRVLNKITGK